MATARTARFDPRPRTGGDDAAPADARIWIVSIRAPARGATPGRKRAKENIPCFDPRPRTGGDAARGPSNPALASFDPRPRTGGDHANLCGIIERCFVSIRAPARGATR